MKKLTKLLTRFTIFSATACANLFGLPALATRHPFILQSELSRLELNGACSYDGKPLILLEQAYCAYDCYHGIAQYVATAICPNEIAKVSPPRAISSPGPSSAPLPKTKRTPAIGPPLMASPPTANMIWNAVIIIDVQLFALACYNVWLYNSIINQTAKQNYFSVSTKLFKLKSA